MSTSQTWSYM
ncbi:hypothetical protein F383_37219 [Gossypium arboreum]|uniref:Uncharacterized protein n=1 Tax=Gossypium arboreum TaxID=29729 RepID=A0A0B0MC58_GOSAR|nr:hypothetical protein F383_37219 [Gossypium arboreum]